MKTCPKTGWYGVLTCVREDGHPGLCCSVHETPWEQCANPAVTKHYCPRCGELVGIENDGTQGGSASSVHRACPCVRSERVSKKVDEPLIVTTGG